MNSVFVTAHKGEGADDVWTTVSSPNFGVPAVKVTCAKILARQSISGFRRRDLSQQLSRAPQQQATLCALTTSNFPKMAAIDMDGVVSKSLFAQIQFYIVETGDLQGDSAREVRVPTFEIKDDY